MYTPEQIIQRFPRSIRTLCRLESARDPEVAASATWRMGKLVDRILADSGGTQEDALDAIHQAKNDWMHANMKPEVEEDA